MSRALASWTVCNETMLFYANGGNYQERSRAAELFKERQLSFAVVTDSALVRGFATALGWLGTNVAAFSWAHSDDAGLWLGHAPDVARALSDELRRVKWRLEEQLRMQRAAP